MNQAARRGRATPVVTNQWKCDYCQAKFSNRDNFSIHVQTCKKIKERKDKKPKKWPKNGKSSK